MEKFEKREVFCMFKYADNDLGYIQCTIKREFKADFIKLGFVDHIDKLARTKKTRKEKEPVQVDAIGQDNDSNN